MSDQPRRLQRSRSKGWRKPANAVIVCRPSRFGNPFTPRGCRAAGYSGTDQQIKAMCVATYHQWLTSSDWQMFWGGDESERRRQAILDALPQLRGKDLICYCSPEEPCHADVLLDLANRSSEVSETSEAQQL